MVCGWRFWCVLFGSALTDCNTRGISRQENVCLFEGYLFWGCFKGRPKESHPCSGSRYILFLALSGIHSSIGNEPFGDPLKDHQKGWFVGVIPSFPIKAAMPGAWDSDRRQGPAIHHAPWHPDALSLALARWVASSLLFLTSTKIEGRFGPIPFPNTEFQNIV